MKAIFTLLALIGGSTVIAAIAASAASLQLTTQKVGAKSIPVPSCDTVLAASWTTGGLLGLPLEVKTMTVSNIRGGHNDDAPYHPRSLPPLSRSAACWPGQLRRL